MMTVWREPCGLWISRPLANMRPQVHLFSLHHQIVLTAISRTYACYWNTHKAFGMPAQWKGTTLICSWFKLFIQNHRHQFKIVFLLSSTLVRLLNLSGLFHVTYACLSGLSSFIEPNNLVYDIPIPALHKVLAEIKPRLGLGHNEEIVTDKCRKNRVNRILLQNEASDCTVRDTRFKPDPTCLILGFAKNESIMGIAKSSKTHWRYALVAVRCLRTLVRRDKPITSAQMAYFLETLYDSQPNIVSRGPFLLLCSHC